MEGDTPAFLSLIPNGLSVPERPGGRYGLYVPEPTPLSNALPAPGQEDMLVAETRPIWTNADDHYVPYVPNEYGRSVRRDKWKADFFIGLGFAQDQPSVLEGRLLDIARDNDVSSQVQTPYGTKYLIDGNLLTPEGRSIRLRTVWIVERSDPRPRLLQHTQRKETMDTPNELDIVVLRRSLDEYGLEEGDVGAVVPVYKGGSALEAEFVTGEGETIAVVTLEPDDVRPLGGREVLHARNLAA